MDVQCVHTACFLTKRHVLFDIAFLNRCVGSWIRWRPVFLKKYLCLSRRLDVCRSILDQDGNISKTTVLHSLWRMNPNDFGDLLTFPVAPPADQSCKLSSEIAQHPLNTITQNLLHCGRYS